ncbi:NADPH-dependent FMN reductase [Dietzia sp.]|uniref:NADPH-dependent FMN reductase n=1 Tax=Dietzia sp. TaxID=1871616 RepID=UPI002FD93604
MPHTAVVVGNPKPKSRTLAAATHLATVAAGSPPDTVVDLADFGAEILDWGSAPVAEAVATVGAADLVVFASPTFKGSYTGLLKLFLDRFDARTGLSGLAVPLMLGGSPGHSLAPELQLRPILSELGATILGRALYILDSEYERPEVYAEWLADNKRIIDSVLAAE